MVNHPFLRTTICGTAPIWATSKSSVEVLATWPSMEELHGVSQLWRVSSGSILVQNNQISWQYCMRHSR